MFALFFLVPLAVAATAVVHFANNLFKLGLLAKQDGWRVIVRFSVPAVLTTMTGANLLTWFDRQPALVEYSLAGVVHEITAGIDDAQTEPLSHLGYIRRSGA